MVHTFHPLRSSPYHIITHHRFHNFSSAIPFDYPTVHIDPAFRNFGSRRVYAVTGNIKRPPVLRNSNPAAVAITVIELESAAEVVRKFYGGVNSRDLASVEGLIAQNCVYEDLVFPQPFVGRKAIFEFFNKFSDSISSDLQFVIDDISEEDTSAVGVTWHLEWKGKAFPFSKGCSFYRLEVVNGQRQIVYGRDVVEPAIKPGEAALVAIRGVTWLLQKFPSLADRL